MKIFLVGLMGSGKSYWTKQLAKKYKTGGYDLDYLIEVKEEKTIAEIFTEDGEATVLKWFDQKKTYVLATGGGAPCFFDNMAWMNKQGITIWLDEPLPVIAARLAPEKAHRPLIAKLSDSELLAFLEKQRAERLSFYSSAQIHLQDETITPDSFKKALAKL
ncbi:MAG: shikimate kinase [Bacteroidetes bacterium]|nr:shikimate kinase [Bacteroidota bacterium]